MNSNNNRVIRQGYQVKRFLERMGWDSHQITLCDYKNISECKFRISF